MDVETVTIYHLIKSEDLNHHGTLFAGRSAEWFVESGFIAAARLVPPEWLLCLKIHGMEFTTPVHCGEIICFESKVVHTGRSSLVSYIRVVREEKLVLDGFITFVYVDQEWQIQGACYRDHPRPGRGYGTAAACPKPAKVTLEIL